MIETKIIENVGVIYLAKPDLINALDIDMVRNIKRMNKDKKNI